MEKLADMERQVTRSAKSAEIALKRLCEASKRENLLVEEAKILHFKLRKIVMAGDSAIADADG